MPFTGDKVVLACTQRTPVVLCKSGVLEVRDRPESWCSPGVRASVRGGVLEGVRRGDSWRGSGFLASGAGDSGELIRGEGKQEEGAGKRRDVRQDSLGRVTPRTGES